MRFPAGHRLESANTVYVLQFLISIPWLFGFRFSLVVLFFGLLWLLCFVVVLFFGLLSLLYSYSGSCFSALICWVGFLGWLNLAQARLLRLEQRLLRDQALHVGPALLFVSPVRHLSSTACGIVAHQHTTTHFYPQSWQGQAQGAVISSVRWNRPSHCSKWPLSINLGGSEETRGLKLNRQIIHICSIPA